MYEIKLVSEFIGTSEEWPPTIDMPAIYLREEQND